MRDESITKPCLECGKLFFQLRQASIFAKQMYCSHRCASNAMIGRRSKETLESKFWKRVQISESCWLWTGKKLAKYGYLSVRDERSVKAHRFSYELHYGPIPDGLLVCHHCDNPPCVRPDHLFLGTQADNNRDKMIKGRHRAAHSETHHSAKLTNTQVQEIRILSANGSSRKSVAEIFNVTTGTISHIVTGRNWQHVT